MFHRLKSTSPKYQFDCWRVKGLTGVERWPLQTSNYGPSPLWLRKEFETAGHGVKVQKVSHWFPTALELLYFVAHTTESVISLLLYWLADPSHLWLCFCFRITTLALSWLTNALKFLSSNPAVDLSEVSYKSCLNQDEFDGPECPLQKPFAGQVDRFPEIMAINAMTICA